VTEPPPFRPEGVLELAVADAGRGVGDGFDPLALPGVGVQIMRAFVARHRGHVTFSNRDPGSVVRIRLALD